MNHDHTTNAIETNGRPMATAHRANTLPHPMRYMSVTEVAAALYVDRSTVLRQIGRGELEAVRVGHQWRIWPGDVPGLERLRDEVGRRAV